MASHICFLLYLLYSLSLSIKSVSADTPANCTYEDARGSWLFEVCEHPHNCSELSKKQFIFNLLYPNGIDVIKGYGSDGTWTLIYNQGFEVIVAHRKWLVMFAYDANGTSLCDRGLPGWSHDTLLRQPWWFTSRKLSAKRFESRRLSFTTSPDLTRFNQLFRADPSFVNQINSAQSSWKAVLYPRWEKFTLHELLRIRGGQKAIYPRPVDLFDRSRLSPELLRAGATLPKQFDWRDVDDGRRNPVTPVRDQGVCGSCYAFASAAALEARIRIVSNFTQQPILSPQDIVDCSPYSEGCDGGFPYLIAGKYAEDYGISEESCDPYTGVKADTCPVKSDCPRFYATNYHYVGGYYGACNEMSMKLELVTNGPFPIGFEVYNDFLYYESGIYHHTHLKSSVNRFDPFELTNHAVLLVGYGYDEKLKLPYWTVKNSWGTTWGENGYFRILRGSDECAVESLGVAFDPVL